METGKLKKPWYKTWWGILIQICFWPFSLSYWFWKKAKFSAPVKVVILVIAWIIFLVATNSSKSSSTTNNTAQLSSSSVTQAQQQSDKPAPVPTITFDQKVTEAVKNGFDSQQDDLKVSYDSDTKTAIVTYGDKSTFYDEKSMVQGLFSSFVNVGKKVFVYSGVQNLQMTVRGKFTDSYGKDDIEDAASISMAKDEFNKYNWDNLKYQPIYHQMERSATDLYIHPAILKKINVDELVLD